MAPRVVQIGRQPIPQGGHARAEPGIRVEFSGQDHPLGRELARVQAGLVERRARPIGAGRRNGSIPLGPPGSGSRIRPPARSDPAALYPLPPMPTNVKICGLTNLEDARIATELGAWAIGMIFWDGSPRPCDPDEAERIAGELRRDTQLTGVFVNATLDEIAYMADRCSLAIVQLHGDEGPAFCREAARRTGCRVMKAIRVRDAGSIRALAQFEVDYHLLDAHKPGHVGGTGETFQWGLVAEHGRRVPIVLSGGLTPGNVADAIAATHPFAVDTASGTESEPGRKDHAKLEAFFDAVHQADASVAAA